MGLADSCFECFPAEKKAKVVQCKQKESGVNTNGERSIASSQCHLAYQTPTGVSE